MRFMMNHMLKHTLPFALMMLCSGSVWAEEVQTDPRNIADEGELIHVGIYYALALDTHSRNTPMMIENSQTEKDQREDFFEKIVRMGDSQSDTINDFVLLNDSDEINASELRDLFEVNQVNELEFNETVALLGPNGSGRTSLFDSLVANDGTTQVAAVHADEGVENLNPILDFDNSELSPRVFGPNTQKRIDINYEVISVPEVLTTLRGDESKNQAVIDFAST